MNKTLARSLKKNTLLNRCMAVVLGVSMFMPMMVSAQAPPSGPFMYTGDNDGTDARRYLVIDPTVTDYSKTTNIEEVWETGSYVSDIEQGSVAVTPNGGLFKYETPWVYGPLPETLISESSNGINFTPYNVNGSNVMTLSGDSVYDSMVANNNTLPNGNPITFGQAINNVFYADDSGVGKYYAVYRLAPGDQQLRVAESLDGVNFTNATETIFRPLALVDYSINANGSKKLDTHALDSNNILIRDTTRGTGKTNIAPIVRGWGGEWGNPGNARRNMAGFTVGVSYGNITNAGVWGNVRNNAVMVIETLGDYTQDNVLGPGNSYTSKYGSPMNSPYYSNANTLQGIKNTGVPSPDIYNPGMVHYFDNVVGSPSVFRHDNWTPPVWAQSSGSNFQFKEGLYPTWAFAESGHHGFFFPEIDRSTVDDVNTRALDGSTAADVFGYEGQVYGHDIILNKDTREIYYYVVHSEYHHDVYGGVDLDGAIPIINANQTMLYTLREDGFIGHRAEDQSQSGEWVTHPITVPPAGEANLEISGDRNSGEYYVEVFDKNDTALANPLTGFAQSDYNVAAQPARAYIDTPMDADGYGDTDDDPVLWNPTDDSLAQFAGQEVVLKFTMTNDATLYAFSFEEGEAKYLESELSLTKEVDSRSYEYPNDPPIVNDTILYKITVRNEGTTTVTGINIQDSLGTPDCTPAVSSLAPGEIIECDFSYAISATDISNSATIVNTATLNADGIPEMTSLVEETLQSTSSLSVVKTSTDNTNFSTPAAQVGDIIEYQIVITNDGNTPVTNISIEDTLIDPSALLASCEPFTIAPDGLNPTDSIVCTYQYMLNDADINNKEVQNVVSVMGESGNNRVSGGDLMEIKLPNGNSNNENGGNNNPSETITKRRGSRRTIIKTGTGMPILNDVMDEVTPKEVLAISPDWERCDCSDEVRELQSWLNVNGFNLAAEGLGSYGNESECYGHRTEMAVIRFQETYSDWVLAPLSLEEGTGYFGWKTLSIMQAIDRGEIPLRNPLALWQIGGTSERYVTHDIGYIQRTY